MERFLDSLTKYFHRVHDALETAKKYLFQRNPISDEKHDLHRELLKLLEKECSHSRLDDEILQVQSARYVIEKLRELEHRMNEFNERRVEFLSEANKFVFADEL